MSRSAMRLSGVVLLIAACALTSAPTFGQEGDDMEPIPLTAPKDVDLNGSWEYKISKPTVSGGCPAGNALAGEAEITQAGNEVTLRYTSGAKCRPAAVCSYTGVLEFNETSTDLIVSNTVNVDDEGGEVSSAIHLFVLSESSATGSGTNNYVHPEGFECRWTMEITISRDVEETEE